MLRRFSRSLGLFRNEERGSTMILFGVMAFVLFFAAGMAIDYGRIQDLRTRMGGAIDAALLAVGRELLNGQLTDTELVAFGKTYFRENSKLLSEAMSVIGEPTIVVNRDSGSVDIKANAKIAMTLTRIGGFDTLDVPVASQAVFKQRDIEVGMALDITGSMNTQIKGKTKIASLKSAFAEFADEIFPEQEGPQSIRVALAPYSAGVKLGGYATNITTGPPGKDCIAERANGNFNDSVSKFHISPQCPPPIVKPLTDDKQSLISEVNGYSANGATAGHLGIQWAWNLISDNWGGVWGGASKPDDYQKVKDKKLMKAVVLMTDGDFNTRYSGPSSANQAVELCKAMKAKDVIVFSVGFGLGNSNPIATSTLKACATPGEDYFAAAEDEEDLKAAFRQFAGTLTKLRLSR